MKMNIYTKNKAESSFTEIFKNPGSIYRGAPFWSWNNRLDQEQLCRQIEIFREMGIGGFHMHPRTGMNTSYMGDEYMAAVKACVDKAKSMGMLAWLYDEDRWPSGFAGGLATKEEKYRTRHLLWTPVPYEEKRGGVVNRDAAFDVRAGKGKLLARYAITLRDGFLHEYMRLNDGENAPDGATTWYAYLEIATPYSWFNNETYVDTLNPDAIRHFLDVTHERYREVIGKDFGGTVPAIFTDEPQTAYKIALNHADELADAFFPFTDDFPETYKARYGEDILDKLPEIVWELEDGKPSVTRYRYHDHVTERFAVAFADTVGSWCEKNGILLTGHLNDESTLLSQTRCLGEAMRNYRSFQLPGIDMLCDWREYNTAKQAQSASHQYGRAGVLSELYGVTDWDFDFAGHKSQGDWQAALGVTVRVHHLAWVSMAGEAKRDYPASISYQSPWYKRYPIVEDHFARVNAALTQGKPDVRIGVIHPVESYWLCYGPKDQTSSEREYREYTFSQITEWLLFGLLDFDFICESLLPDLNPKQKGNKFKVGEMAYDVVIVPPMRTIRSTTLDRLEKFVKSGGKVIFCGEVPSLVDAVESDRTKKLVKKAMHIEFSKADLVGALDNVRLIDIRTKDGDPAKNLLYQMRTDNEQNYLFVCNTTKSGKSQLFKVRIRGEWTLSLLDTSTGNIEQIKSNYANNWTEIDWVFHPHGHLLLKLSPGKSDKVRLLEFEPLDDAYLESVTLTELRDPVPVTLSEPNVLVLDQAEWRINNGEWQSKEELLRLDNKARELMGLEPRSGNIAQPWTEPEDNTVLGNLELRFVIDSGVNITGSKLALEEPGSCAITFDEQIVSNNNNGWWVDEAIRTVPMPPISTGTHELVIKIPYQRKTNIEWCYLLGDFGVDVKGRHSRLIEPIRELAFGDITRQGLPFYTGNVTYHCEFENAKPENLSLRTANFSGAMVGVKIDGRDCPGIAYAPYETTLGNIAPGKHKLDLTLYGNRYNAFGTLHLAKRRVWAGPGAWRSRGDEWCYEYMLRPLGILSAPRVRRK